MWQNPDPSSCSEETHETEGGGDNEQDLSPEELRVMERKLKKIQKKEEKKRLREEGLTLPKKQAVRPSASNQALDYLTWWETLMFGSDRGYQPENQDKICLGFFHVYLYN